jgi:transcriptional regulator with XRE-family HTH domain
MSKRPEQRPEGKLLALAMKRSRISQREAARRADMSEGHLRAIVSGSRSVSKGVWIPVRGAAEPVARIAQTVGVTPEQLEEAERADAAAELREMKPPNGDEAPDNDVERAERLLAEALALLQRDRDRRSTG